MNTPTLKQMIEALLKRDGARKYELGHLEAKDNDGNDYFVVKNVSPKVSFSEIRQGQQAIDVAYVANLESALRALLPVHEAANMVLLRYYEKDKMALDSWISALYLALAQVERELRKGME